MRDHLVLYINGKRHTAEGRDAFLSLSDYLRLRLGLIGTKIVCSEGDCGACTVLIGRADNPPPLKGWEQPSTVASGDRAQGGSPREATRGGISERRSSNGERAQENTAHYPLPTAHSLRYLPVDSCIQFLFQLDGTHIVTVEGLRPDGQLNPVQQAMVDCHGSQCGFCTPGFVMAMTGLREETDDLDESQLRRGLTGNLCRCTGYTPIIESGLKCNDAQRDRLNELYPPEPLLAEFELLREQPVTLEAEWFGECHIAACPSTLAHALAFLADHPAATIVAGATDLGVRINKSGRLPPVILDLNRIQNLDFIHVGNVGEIQIGALATWADVLAACEPLFPEFTRILSLFGAPQIRHVGTVAGNIANASPIADSLPFLFVSEALVCIASRDEMRVININDFYHGYKQTDLKPGELICAIRIPRAEPADLLRLYKVTRRRDLDISTFTAALRLRLRRLRLSDEETITHAAIALGAVGPTVLRPRRAEQFLLAKPFTEETMQAAADIAVEETTPITDVRGSANYRRQLTRNIFLKFYHQHQVDMVTT